MKRLRALSTFLYRRPRLALLLLLGPPLAAFFFIYLGSLAALLAQSMFALDHYTGLVTRRLTFASYAALLTPSNFDIVLRTAGMAIGVTLAATLLAFPLAYYAAMKASPRMKALLAIAVIVPLWSSFLVRVYSWKLILAKEGIVSWFASTAGLSGWIDGWLALPWVGGPSLSISSTGIFLAFLYVWLPYMILPIQAALERVPASLLEASGDLGATPLRTFVQVTLPLALPGVAAGSIFTFSLTLGDYIVPSVLGNSSYFLGQAVFAHQGTSGNLPLAAAFTLVPMAIMAIYLVLVRRMGAFHAL